jgi:mRNA guanylyltransferase
MSKHIERSAEFPTIGISIPNNHPEHDYVLTTINQLTRSRRNKHQFPGSMCVSMGKDNLRVIKKIIHQYTFSVKADGVRYLLLISNNQAYIVGRNMTVYRITKHIPSRILESCGTALFDGELIVPYIDYVSYIFIVFDCIAIRGHYVGQKNLYERLQCVNQYIVDPIMNNGKKFNTIRTLHEHLMCNSWDNDHQDIVFTVQHFYASSELPKVLESYGKNPWYGTDGLIFVNRTRWYRLGTDRTAFKWKPPHQNSVDFILAINKENPHYLLCHADISDGMVNVGEIMLPKDHEYKDKCVVECRRKDNAWEIMRERPDKDRANAHWVVKKILSTIGDGVTRDMMLEIIRM